MSVATLISGPDLQMCLLSSVHVITIAGVGAGLHVWAGAVPGYIKRFFTPCKMLSYSQPITSITDVEI